MNKFMMFLFTLLFGLQTGKAQKNTGGGTLQLGLRSTLSVFGTDGYVGEGVGGQFRLRFNERMNTEWFADYITTNLNNLGKRTDAHIGWSVMFYPWLPKEPIFTPYVLAGHCFDYTQVHDFSTFYSYGAQQYDRWSSAVQLGLGTHWQLSTKADLSLSAQYMIHFGNDIHAEVHQVHGEDVLHIDSSPGKEGFEGHVFLTLSFNIHIAELW